MASQDDPSLSYHNAFRDNNSWHDSCKGYVNSNIIRYCTSWLEERSIFDTTFSTVCVICSSFFFPKTSTPLKVQKSTVIVTFSAEMCHIRANLVLEYLIKKKKSRNTNISSYMNGHSSRLCIYALRIRLVILPGRIYTLIVYKRPFFEIAYIYALRI